VTAGRPPPDPGGMSNLMAGGLGLIGAAAAAGLGSLAAASLAALGWTAGAWLAVAATALTYRRLASDPRRTVPAAALALLGVVASARTVETTLRIAYRHSDIGPTSALATVAGGVGLGLLAWAIWRAGLVRQAVGMGIAGAALAGSFTADPGVPYLLGAGPLGVALLLAQLRVRAATDPAPAGSREGAPPTPGRAERVLTGTRFEVKGSLA
jgi:hypothetical protein